MTTASGSDLMRIMAKALRRVWAWTLSLWRSTGTTRSWSLTGKTIDCVWNGMTLTAEVTSSMECTDAYLNNAQVVVVPKDVADQYQDEESLVGPELCC